MTVYLPYHGDSTGTGARTRCCVKNARYLQKRRSGSRRRPARCRHGVPIRERESDNIQSAASSVELFLQRSHQVDASNLTVSNRPNRLAKVILTGGPLHRGRINPWALVGNDFLSPKGFASVGRPWHRRKVCGAIGWLAPVPIQIVAVVAEPVTASACAPLMLRYITARWACAVVVVNTLADWLAGFIDRVKICNPRHFRRSSFFIS